MKPAITPTLMTMRKLRGGPLKNTFNQPISNWIAGLSREKVVRVIYMQPSLTLAPVCEDDTGAQVVTVGDYAIMSHPSAVRIGVVTGHEGVITILDTVAVRASILDAVGAAGLDWLARAGVADSTTLSDVYGYPHEATISYSELMLRLSLPDGASEVVHELVKSHGMQLWSRRGLPRHRNHPCDQEAIKWVVKSLLAADEPCEAGIVYHPVSGWQHLKSVTVDELGQATFALVIAINGIVHMIGDTSLIPLVKPLWRRVKLTVHGDEVILCNIGDLKGECVFWIFAKGQWVPFSKDLLPSADEILKRSYTTYVDMIIGFNKGDQV